MATALAELGVTESTLDPETAERLDRDGYAPLPGVLSDAQLDAIRARLAGLLAAEGDQAGVEVHQEVTRRGHGQQLDQKKYIRPQTLAVLSPAAQVLLDV
jgi:hypothetical protein